MSQTTFLSSREHSHRHEGPRSKPASAKSRAQNLIPISMSNQKLMVGIATKQKYEQSLSKGGKKMIHRTNTACQTNLDTAQFVNKLARLDEYELKWETIKQDHEDLKRLVKLKDKEIGELKVDLMHLTMNKISLELQIDKMNRKLKHLPIQDQIQELQKRIDNKYLEMKEVDRDYMNYYQVKAKARQKKNRLFVLVDVFSVMILPLHREEISIDPDLLEPDAIRRRLKELYDCTAKDMKISQLQKKIASLNKNREFSKLIQENTNAVDSLNVQRVSVATRLAIFAQIGIQTDEAPREKYTPKSWEGMVATQSLVLGASQAKIKELLTQQHSERVLPPPQKKIFLDTNAESQIIYQEAAEGSSRQSTSQKYIQSKKDEYSATLPKGIEMSKTQAHFNSPSQTSKSFNKQITSMKPTSIRNSQHRGANVQIIRRNNSSSSVFKQEAKFVRNQVRRITRNPFIVVGLEADHNQKSGQGHSAKQNFMGKHGSGPSMSVYTGNSAKRVVGGLNKRLLTQGNNTVDIVDQKADGKDSTNGRQRSESKQCKEPYKATDQNKVQQAEQRIQGLPSKKFLHNTTTVKITRYQKTTKTETSEPNIQQSQHQINSLTYSRYEQNKTASTALPKLFDKANTSFIAAGSCKHKSSHFQSKQKENTRCSLNDTYNLQPKQKPTTRDTFSKRQLTPDKLGGVESHNLLIQIQSLLASQDIDSFQSAVERRNHKRQVDNYIRMFEQMHKRCGANCSHLLRFYALLKQFTRNSRKKMLVLPKRDY